MKRSTAATREMSDIELSATRQRLARSIPDDQRTYDAVKAEQRRRKRNRDKAAKAAARLPE